LPARPRIGITLGDPGGIGPEVLLKALQKLSGNFIIFGSRRVLLDHSRRLKIPFDRSRVQVVDIDNIHQPFFGPAPEISGTASIQYLDAAFAAFYKSEIDAIVTGPIQKESWHASGFHYPGQTEYCALKTKTKEFCMLMAGKRFKIGLLSTHLSLKAALREVKRGNIVRKLKLLNEEFRKIGFAHPRIACAAVNPHAGEKGAFGTEEMEQIEPALRQARDLGIQVDGPIAPEVVFRVASNSKQWDVVLAMYHDQAMIPLKLLEFESSANVTVGLPIIRTSPDHGTAFDIAGRGIANPGSMIYAIKIASEWTKRRINAKAQRRKE
jgi:4-phospho-D-threonate 3-dehydrogenase / 4-phospho-D-erythronate 3-dehydrogenase